MRVFLYVLVFVLCLSFVCGSNIDNEKFILSYAREAKLLDSDTDSVVFDVYNFVSNDFVVYDFSYQPQELITVVNRGKGDCSDISTITMYMLESIGIRTKRVHGWLNGVKHDSFEYYSQKQWKTIESNDFTKIGGSYW